MPHQNSRLDQSVELMRRVHAGEAFDLAQMPRCDVHLRGIAWTQNDTDLELSLSAHVQGVNLDWILVARWVHGLKVDLNYGARSSGMPMTWDTLIEQNADDEWFVLFDFASRGELRFSCSGLEIHRTRPDNPESTASQFVIVLNSTELANPDTDLAVLVPQAIERLSNGFVVADRWAYDQDEAMHLYFHSANASAGLRAIKAALANGPICGNDLSNVVIASRSTTDGNFRVLSPADQAGAEITAAMSQYGVG